MLAVGVVSDVPEAEVVAHERVGEAEHGDRDERHRAVGAEAGGLSVLMRPSTRR